MRRRVLVAVPLVLLLLVVGVRAADEPIRLPLTAADVPPPRVDWYGAYVQNAKIGWVRMELAKESDAFVTAFSASLDLTSLGQTLKMEMTERDEFDAAAPFAFRAGRTETKQNGTPQSVELKRGKTGFSATVTQGGETHAPPVADVDFTLADMLAEELWFRAPRAVGETVRFRSFSLEDLQADVDTIVVKSRKESVVEGVPTVFYEATQKSDRKGDSMLARVDARGKLLSMFIGNVFEARLEPEDVAKQTGKGQDLFVLGMAKLDKPIGDATNVDRLVLDAAGAGAKTLVAAPRQSVVRDEKTGAVTLEIGAEFGDAAATPKDVEKALTETVDLPTKSPTVVTLAVQAVGDAKSPREKADRLVHFVHAFIKGDLTVSTVMSVPEIIAQKRGVCREYALLFAALARAAGIPARRVAGLMYMGDDVKAFGGHAWDEVALDGKWVPVDPTWDETVLDAGHVTLAREDAGTDIWNALGAVQFRLKDVHHLKERAK